MVPAVAIALSAAPQKPPAPAMPPINDGHGDYVYVPAGAFRMGDNFGDGEPRERPVHVVDLDAFYIAKYEMTNGEWKAFRDDPGYDDVTFWPDRRVAPKDQIPYWTQPNNHGGATPGSDNYPVLGVNWDSAVAYCNWLSAKTGKKYRLPTEAEWEKAARGTDARHFPWGNDFGINRANTPMYWVSLKREGDTAPVGAFADGASAYGLYDMSGNVWEWTASWYQAYPGNQHPNENYGENYKTLKGGSWWNCSFYKCGISAPSYNRSFFLRTTKNNSFGFRCAKDAP